MVALRLSARDRKALDEAARHRADARRVSRASALLDLDAGELPGRIADRYQVSRSTVYKWTARWRDPDRPRGDRLRDAARSGRPTGLPGVPDPEGLAGRVRRFSSQ